MNCKRPMGPYSQRLAAVVNCCLEFVRDQLNRADGVCSFVSFDDDVEVMFQRQELDDAAHDISCFDLEARYGTMYFPALEAAIDICDEHPANHYCIVFLSDGLPGDLHMNSARDESRLYDVMDRLKDSCENLTFHTIGFGPADFVWLRKMAAAVKGKFHDHTPGASGNGSLSGAELMRTFKSISDAFTKMRTGTTGGNHTHRRTLMPAQPQQGYRAAPRNTWEGAYGDVLTWDGRVHADIYSTPFSEGGVRNAHRFRFAPHSQHVRTGLNLPNDLVSKDSKTVGLSQGEAFKEMECQFKSLQTAQHMAYEWNKRTYTQVRFIPCFGYKCTFRGQSRYLYIEEYLEGGYVKYNGNKGYVQDTRGLSQDGYANHEVAQAFSHYSWVVSGGQYLVCDIQGVGLTWTDPQVNSVHRSYGQCDLGHEGIHAFFASHRCNVLCRHLNVQGCWPRN